MNSVVRRIFMNFEKEEKWLNDMATKGLNFAHYSPFKYLFDKGTPGEYIYRIELLDKMPSHPESKVYIEFMEEAGIECVSTFYRWVYLRKKAEDGAFDLYTDYDSRISFYKKVSRLVGIALIINLLVAMYNSVLGLSIGHERGVYFNLYISTMNWIFVLALAPLYFNMKRKINKLKKEKKVYE
jgi:hypothetical protein